MVQDTLKQKILNLRVENKTYNEIMSILKCSKGTISYYLGKDQKAKTNNRKRENRQKNPLLKKFNAYKFTFYTQVNKNILFKTRKINSIIMEKTLKFRKRGTIMSDLNFQDVLLKIGDQPKCYLTGRTIDLSKPKTYHFDHIVPVSKGGKNTIDNFGLTSKEANMAKNDLLLEDFIKLCSDVLINNGYTVYKNN